MKNDFLNDAPLYMALREYAGRGMSSFHTPGHKGSGFVFEPDLSMDLTELPDTDSLYECDGVIRQSEIRAAELFGSGYTALSSGGCTLAIQGMLAAFAGPCSKVVFSRNIHRSAVNAAMLLDIDPVWAVHRRDGGRGLPGRVRPEEISKILAMNPDAAAVYITSPDYWGCLSDVKGIAGVCAEYGVPLLVDNAHGTHLIAFGRHPMTLGVSASACSAHKTLPVLTGGAWLNCSDAKMGERVKSSMALFGSTSPSYLTMASLDAARAWMMSEGMAAFRELADVVSELKSLAADVGFGLPEGECDPVRLTLLTGCVGMSGVRAAEYFRGAGAECEHSDSESVIFILTPFNSGRDIARLRQAIAEFPVSNPLPEVLQPDTDDFLPEKLLTPGETFRKKRRSIPAKESAGRIAAEAACPCPPGIPVVMPGEIIDEKCVNILLKTGINRINVIE